MPGAAPPSGNRTAAVRPGKRPVPVLPPIGSVARSWPQMRIVPRVGGNDAREAAQRRRFARAVRPHQAHHLARLHGERQLVHRRELAVQFGQSFNFNHDVKSFRSPPRPGRRDTTSPPLRRKAVKGRALVPATEGCPARRDAVPNFSPFEVQGFDVESDCRIHEARRMDEGVKVPQGQGMLQPSERTCPSGKGGRPSRRLLWQSLAGFFVAGFIAWLWWESAHRAPPQIITLPNGERYQFAGVTYGTNNVPPYFPPAWSTGCRNDSPTRSGNFSARAYRSGTSAQNTNHRSFLSGSGEWEPIRPPPHFCPFPRRRA